MMMPHDIFRNIKEEMGADSNLPTNTFDGLSATQYHYLVYEPHHELSVVRFKKSISANVLDQISLFRVAEVLIKIIAKEQTIKLTPLGALPKMVVLELYEKRYVLDEHIEDGIYKLNLESRVPFLTSLRISIEKSGIVKKRDGKLSLTQKGTSFLLPENRQAFFECFICAFAEKLDWGIHDGYPDVPVGQHGWLFSIYLLGKYGKDFQPKDLYAKKYDTAFPNLIPYFEDSSFRTIDEHFSGCYDLRTFVRFLLWFNLIIIDQPLNKVTNKDAQVKTSELFNEVFDITVA